MMKLRWFPIVLLILVVPSVLFARWSKDTVEMKNEATGTIVFSHTNHLEALGKNCPTCHNGIFNIDVTKNPDYTMKDMENGKACGACHDGSTAFSVGDNCSVCHPTRDVKFEVPDIGPVTFSHDVNISMFGCDECHPDLFIPGPGNKSFTMEDMAEGEARGACHDGSTAFSFEDNCDVCHQM